VTSRAHGPPHSNVHALDFWNAGIDLIHDRSAEVRQNIYHSIDEDDPWAQELGVGGGSLGPRRVSGLGIKLLLEIRREARNTHHFAVCTTRELHGRLYTCIAV
jgi:hypothetical protein